MAHQAGVVDAVTQMARTGEVAYAVMPDVGEDPTGYWSSSRDDVLEALDRPEVVNRVGVYWWGESTIDEILGFAQWDPLAHTWDLAQAAGLTAHGSQEVAEVSLGIIGEMADTLRSMDLIAEPVQVPADSDPFTRFLALTGRNPLR